MAFVAYEDPEVMHKVLSMKEMEIEGCRVRLIRAENKDQRPAARNDWQDRPSPRAAVAPALPAALPPPPRVNTHTHTHTHMRGLLASEKHCSVAATATLPCFGRGRTALRAPLQCCSCAARPCSAKSNSIAARKDSNMVASAAARTREVTCTVVQRGGMRHLPMSSDVQGGGVRYLPSRHLPPSSVSLSAFASVSLSASAHLTSKQFCQVYLNIFTCTSRQTEESREHQAHWRSAEQ